MVARMKTVSRHRVSEVFRSIAILYNEAKDPDDCWHNRETLQAYQDVFRAAKAKGLITNYDLRTGEVTYKEWR